MAKFLQRSRSDVFTQIKREFMKHLFPALLLCTGFVSALPAQNTPRLLTLDEALNITLTENPQIKASAYATEAAIKERKATYGLRLPKLNVTGAYAYLSDDIGFDLNGLKDPLGGVVNSMSSLLPPPVLMQASELMKADWSLPIQDRSFGTVGANLTIPLYTGGKINAANRAAKIKIGESQQQDQRNRNALVSELVERYYGLSLALQVTEVRKQVLEGMRQHLHDAVELEKNGIIARGERLYAEVSSAEAERNYLESIKTVETLRSALSNTLNTQEEFTPISTLFILNEIENVDHFKQMALDNSPMLKQVSLKRDLAVEGMKLQRADFAPQVALMGAASFYNYQVTKLMPRWAVGAGVTFKIFDGLGREYKYSAARAQIRQVEALGQKANNDVFTLIDKLYNEMLTYKEQFPSLEASYAFAVEYLRIKKEAFKEGMASSSDVVDAQLNLAKIKTERLQAAYYYDLMLARLLEACGLSQSLPEYAKRTSAQHIRYEE